MLIEKCFPCISGLISIKTHSDLFFIVLFGSEFWKSIRFEILKSCSFDVLLKASANQGTEYKHFANAISIQWKIVFCAILNSDDTDGFHI